MIRIDRSLLSPYLDTSDFQAIEPRVRAAHEALIDGSGAGASMLGWRDLLRSPNDALLEEISAVAAEIRDRADVLLCIGIGGSYLGAEAVIQATTPFFRRNSVTDESDRSGPEILFAGQHMGSRYLSDLLNHIEGRSVYVNVISKSGTTLEPALSFRFVRSWMHDRFADASQRIIATTDSDRGALRELAERQGYRRFAIPDSVGGRFSVLSPVGLLPIATAGVDIRALFYGAVASCRTLESFDENPAAEYAAARCLLEERGFAVDLMAVFEPQLAGIAAWWQQLFGESEGKGHRGMFPAPVRYSTDLHSIGQFVQDGARSLAETFLMVERPDVELHVPSAGSDLDGLDYLVGRSMHDINLKAYSATASAHREGGVPVLTLWVDSLSAEAIGQVIYFFEHSVAIGGYLLGVNPFDQPGVEAYKKKMFSLLGRPGK